jgi:hypothetical protein
MQSPAALFLRNRPREYLRGNLGGKKPNGFDESMRLVGDVVWVKPDRAINLRKTLGQRQRPAASVRSGPDCDDPCHARRLGPCQHRFNIGRQFRKIEMCVRVGEHPLRFLDLTWNRLFDIFLERVQQCAGVKTNRSDHQKNVFLSE